MGLPRSVLVITPANDVHITQSTGDMLILGRDAVAPCEYRLAMGTVLINASNLAS